MNDASSKIDLRTVSSVFERAMSLHQQGDQDGAATCCMQVLQSDPLHGGAWHLRGLIALQGGECERGVELIQRSLQISPGQPAAHCNLGSALLNLQRPAQALRSFEQAIALHGQFAPAWHNRGNALRDLGRVDEAILSYNEAVRLGSSDPLLYCNLGNVLLRLRRHAEALGSFNYALQLDPREVKAHIGRGESVQRLFGPEHALREFEQALTLAPDSVLALNYYGGALLRLRRVAEALEAFQRVLRLQPQNADAHHNCGSALLLLERHQEALQAYDAALRAHAARPETLIGRSHVLSAMARSAESRACLEQALALSPGHDFLVGQVLHARLADCDWSGYAERRIEIGNWVEANCRAIAPLSFLALSHSAALQLRCARIHAQASGALARKDPLCHKGYGHRRIRVAYLSANFGDHPVSYLLAGVLEAHDKERFETFGIALRAEERSAAGRRMVRAFDRFIDIGDRSDADVARWLREREIDIAVDLMGYTKDARTAVYAHRPAPVQVNYLGYPGTMGVPFMDYVIADGIAVPTGEDEFFSEKVVRLPHCFLPNDRSREIGPRPTRREAGLPERGFVFCAFTKTEKITPGMFEVWMRLLRQVEGGVLWLRDISETARVNLGREACARGIAPERLIFAPRVAGVAAHLGRHGLADLFLDTWPYNAHSTACDALWAGVPVLSCAGGSFAGRVAASALAAVGLPEQITHSLEGYERRALELAQNGALLAEVRHRLADNRLRTPLFDTERYCRHLEAAYVRMWECAERGAAPSGFRIEPTPDPLR